MLRPSTSQFRRHVASTERFGALEAEALDDFSSAHVCLGAGRHTIFLQRDAARSLYLVLERRLRLTAWRPDRRRERLVRRALAVESDFSLSRAQPPTVPAEQVFRLAAMAKRHGFALAEYKTHSTIGGSHEQLRV